MYFRPSWERSVWLGHLFRPSPQWSWHPNPSLPLFWQSISSWHLFCSFLFWPFLLRGGASGLGLWSPPYFSLLFLFPRSPAPISVILLSIFRKIVGWLYYSHQFTLPFRRKILLSFCFLCDSADYLSAPITAKSSVLFGHVQRQPQARWPFEVEKTVRKRPKVFSSVDRSDKEHQAYISVSRYAFIVITKAKAKAWPKHDYLWLKCNPKLVNFILSSLAQAMRRKAKSYLSKNRWASHPKESYSSYYSLFNSTEFFAGAANLLSSTAASPDNQTAQIVAYPCWSASLALT